MTKKYGILAYPAKHSLSPVMQNAAFKHLAIDARYGIFEMPESKIEAFIKNAKKNIDGFSVSLPYKEKIIKYLDFVDEDAKKIGAVNTVKNDEGRLFGYNTDYIGAIKALKETVKSLNGKSVVVFGAGGAARAVIYGLLKEKAAVKIINRHIEKARIIAEDFRYIFGTNIECFSTDDKMNVLNSAILIHATSIWTTNPSTNQEEANALFPNEFVDKFDFVMDISYAPLVTPLLEKAQNLGKKIITGDRMLLLQAAEQFKIWIGKEAPIEIMAAALK